MSIVISTASAAASIPAQHLVRSIQTSAAPAKVLDPERARAAALDYGVRLESFVRAIQALVDIPFGLPEQPLSPAPPICTRGAQP